MWAEAGLVVQVEQVDLLELAGEADLVDLADLPEGVGLSAQVALVVVGFDLTYLGWVDLDPLELQDRLDPQDPLDPLDPQDPLDD